VHSVLGEVLIFNGKRSGGLVPTNSGTDLKQKHLRIIWATWHLVSILGCLIGLILLRTELSSEILPAISVAMFLGGVLVLVATKGRHPGWIVLFLIGVLVLLGA